MLAAPGKIKWGERMKRVLCGVLLFLIVSMAAGCGDRPPSIESLAPSSGSAQGAAPLSANDLVLSIGGKEFRLDDNIALVTAVLGTEYEYSETISCEYDGMDKIFTYDGVEFYTYPEGEEDFLHEILLLTPKYQTARGIAVDDSKDQVTAAYGEEFEDKGGIWVYKADSGALWFYFTGDTVRSVSFAKE